MEEEYFGFLKSVSGVNTPLTPLEFWVMLRVYGPEIGWLPAVAGYRRDGSRRPGAVCAPAGPMPRNLPAERGFSPIHKPADIAGL